MKNLFLKTCLPLGAAVLFTGCIDDNYDLSDIDKTTQINVNGLVVPVNLDAIELSEIIKIDEGSKIKIVNVGGTDIYAVSQTGDFHSDPIEISGFEAPAPEIQDARATFELIPETRSISVTHNYELGSFTPQKVEIIAENIDKSILEVNSIDCEPMHIKMSLITSGFSGHDTMIKFRSVKMKFLKGLTILNIPQNYSYDPKTGLLTITNLECPGNVAEINLDVVAVDFNTAGTHINGHTLNYTSSVTLEEADMQLSMTFDENEPPTPEEIVFTVTTTCEPMKATYFSGKVEYALEGDALNIEPVSLDDIPDFLSNEETSLRLANPQIYLSLNNPMADFNLGFQTGLLFSAIRGDQKEDFPMNPGQIVSVGTNYGVTGPYNFVLSPSMPQHPLADYSKDLKHVGYSNLSNILAGSGIPNSLDIKLVDPMLPEQSVNHFELGTSIPGIEGQYEFFAPLALAGSSDGKPGSTIVYSGTEDGWSDDEVDKISITHLEVSADAFSNLPVDAEVYVYPINKDGEKIPVKVTPAILKAGANGDLVTVVIEPTGEPIRNLNGINYEAVVKGVNDNDTPLSPEQTIRMANIRAKVTGYYLTNFD